MSKAFTIGLIINPVAGLGGSVGFKGSDAEGTKERALALGATPQAQQRALQAFRQLGEHGRMLQFVTAAGELGENVAKSISADVEVVYQAASEHSTAADTRALVQLLSERSDIDLLVFVGGDGTARDVAASYPDDRPVLGIPAGVKIHSGVYAISPRAAGNVILDLLTGKLASVIHADVMDIDEEAFQRGTVRARRFGELLVPAELRYVQAVKMGGKESDELVLADIAAEVIERIDPDRLTIMGSGSTVDFIMQELGLPNTLLGVDVIYRGDVIAADVTANQLLELIDAYGGADLVITMIGGQGHLLGRGNQQLSPAVIRAIGRDHIWVVATKRKLHALDGRPLLVDSGDPELDDELAGLQRVITGYRDEVFVAVQSI
ncbi:ATP-NAD kinase [Pseudidiomarina aestuarii]|nr:ATP-NAD kinase [Pseudidiomarina aestuarii]